MIKDNNLFGIFHSTGTLPSLCIILKIDVPPYLDGKSIQVELSAKFAISSYSRKITTKNNKVKLRRYRQNVV